MKKILIGFVIALFWINIAFSHPLDISVSTGTIRSNYLHITSYFHSYEIEYLLRENNINPKDLGDYYIYDEILEKEILKNITLENNSSSCKMEKFKTILAEPYEILSDGFGVTFSFTCEQNIKNINFTNKMFINFPLQTNRITLNIYKDNKTQPVYFKVLTSKINSFYLDLDNIDNEKIDSDNDGLSDEEESIYATDKNNADTDGDNYSDKEEIDFGWNPIDKELGPGQEYREKGSLETSIKKLNHLEKIDKELYSKNLSDYGQGNNFLKKVLKYINDYFRGNSHNLAMVFFIVFSLGFLHAAGPGHGKTLLMAYTLEKQNGYKKGMIYAAIFTTTHILDIVVLFFVSTIFFAYVDVSKYVYYIQILSAGFLFALSIYLIIRKLKNKSLTQGKKPTLMIAFLSGLAPCSFAWSIYLLLLALGKTYWIIPLIFALGLGIFVFLLAIVILTVFIRKKAYKKLETFEKYSSWISIMIIFLISLVLMYNLVF